MVRNGIGGSTQINYNAKYVGVNGHFDHFGANFHNTELGFLGARTNRNDLNSGIFLTQPDPHGWLRSVFANLYGGRDWTNEGLPVGKWVGTFSNINFINFWRVFFGFQRNFAAFDDLDTRGGPPIVRPANTFLNGGFNSDSRKQYGFGIRANGVRDDVGGWWITFSPDARLQLSPRLLGAIGVEYTSAIDSAQWIKNTDTNGDGADDNVYGRLRRHVVNITGRATYSFTRDMTLEAYLQPFVAVGDYTNIGRLTRAKSFDFRAGDPGRRS